MRLAQHLQRKQYPKSLLGEYMKGLTATVGPQFDPDAQTLFTAMTVQPSNEHKVAINRVIGDLKAGGIWDKLTYLACAGHTQQASLLDWRSPARTPPVFASVEYVPWRGMRATAASGNVRVETWAFANTSNWLPENAFGYVYVTAPENPPNGATRLVESSTDSNTLGLRYRSGSHVANIQNGAPTAFGGADPGIGSVATVRTPGTHKRFLNGVFFDNAPGGYSPGTNGVLLWAGGRELSSNATVGVVALGRALSNPEVLALDTILKSYITFLFTK